MPSFESLLVGVTGRISHEEDFTFPKLKEELAVRFRSEWLPRIRDLWSLESAEVAFDADGDIQVQTDKGALFVTRDAVTIFARGMAVSSIIEGKGLPIVAGVLDELFKARAAFRPGEYSIRFFLRFRFDPPLSVEQWREGMSQLGATHLFHQIDSSHMVSAGWSVGYVESPFQDTLDLDASTSRIEVRQSRRAPASEFPSFEAFIDAAKVANVLERVRPLFAPFIQDAAKISVRE
jgi:hypothetical protein